MVPYLPSLNSYAHVPFGIWIPTNDTVVLEDRPPEDISDLNWCGSGFAVRIIGSYVSGYSLPALMGTGSYTRCPSVAFVVTFGTRNYKT